MSEPTVRDRAAEALLALAAERDFDRIVFADVAGRAGLSLADLRGEFDTILDVLAAFTRGIDRKVLAGSLADLAGEPPRERLFDVLMRRFDELKPYRPALRSVARAFRRDPLMTLRWSRHATVSMMWMLDAAGLESGRFRAQGLALAFARAFRVFLNDDDEGLARTMSELDRRLREGEKRLEFFSRFTRRRRFAPREGEADYSI